LDALQLLAGDAQTFIDKVWASRVHVHHAEAADVAGLLSLDDVDHLLTGTALRTPALRLAKDGAVLPPAKFTRSATLAGVAMTGLVDARKVLDLFDSGATVVLQGLHRYWPPLTGLVRSLELALGHPCQANAYLTPPGSQGFALHPDTHDVFVVQTHGRKLWEVHDETGVREILMQPGTSVYLPTGTPHAACTQETESLHVTIGINQVTWRDVLTRAVSSVLSSHEYDAHLPAGYPRDPEGLTEQLASRVHTVAAAVTRLDPSRAAADEIERFLSTRTSVLRRGLSDRLAVRNLTDDTLLRRRAGSVCEVAVAGETLRVFLGDRELRMPRWMGTPMEQLRSVPQLHPRDLARWLDPDSRLVLTRRLVVEGLLEVVG
jgi:mannose-6-phosphate isomerase-like protein (cupin superfamily)